MKKSIIITPVLSILGLMLASCSSEPTTTTTTTRQTTVTTQPGPATPTTIQTTGYSYH